MVIISVFNYNYYTRMCLNNTSGWVGFVGWMYGVGVLVGFVCWMCGLGLWVGCLRWVCGLDGCVGWIEILC